MQGQLGMLSGGLPLASLGSFGKLSGLPSLGTLGSMGRSNGAEAPRFGAPRAQEGAHLLYVLYQACSTDMDPQVLYYSVQEDLSRHPGPPRQTKARESVLRCSSESCLCILVNVHTCIHRLKYMHGWPYAMATLGRGEVCIQALANHCRWKYFCGCI